MTRWARETEETCPMPEIDRSLIFTCLLENEDFKRLDMFEASDVVTEVVTAWQASKETDMGLFVQRWLEDHPVRTRV